MFLLAYNNGGSSDSEAKNYTFIIYSNNSILYWEVCSDSTLILLVGYCLYLSHW
jgi:hypothetical protein